MSLKRKIDKENVRDFLWIVPSTEHLSTEYFEELENEFAFLDLSQNFLNSKEIVKTTKLHAVETNY